MDRLSPERRSKLMSSIKGKDTLPEMTVRRGLFAIGYRYRLHGKGLPGRPDLVFSARRKVIFVHGCYWHGHTCRYGLAQSKTNQVFWQGKLAANVERDARKTRQLIEQGWAVHVVWECEIKAKAWLDSALAFLNQR